MASKGTINKRVISGNTYYYHQYLDEGKQKSKTLSPQEAYQKAFSIYFPGSNIDDFLNHSFHLKVSYGSSLHLMAASTDGYKKRFCFTTIKDYLSGRLAKGKLLALYGLRRTGKTTLIMQAISDFSFQKFAKSVYIKCEPGNTIYDLFDDLKYLTNNGFQYIFIDEATLLDDFIRLSATLSDIYGLMARIVLSGTDSLGFLLASRNELYDRCLFVHTTYIAFIEFAKILGIKSIDKYIEYGGTMSFEGVNYNHTVKRGDNEINEYVDSSIIHNIIHSMKVYQDGSYYLNLYDLYEKGELENVINRIVEDSNHRFAISTIERVFKSTDYGSLKQLLSLPRNYERFGSVLKEVDEEKLLKDLMSALAILNKEHQTHKIDDDTLNEAEIYLKYLDVIDYVYEVSAPSFVTKKRVVFTQPGLRYSQAKQLLEILFCDESLQKYDKAVLDALQEKLLTDVKGRMIEDMVLLETSKKGEAFKLFFPPEGEFGMVTIDKENLTSTIYEIKHSSERNERQTRFLRDENLISQFEKKYYPIKEKIVLYRGEEAFENGIRYLNIESFLLSLK